MDMFLHSNVLTVFLTTNHRYLIYTRWGIPHRRQAKIEAGSQALVVPTELTRSIISMIIWVLYIAEMDKADNESSFMQLKSI